MSSQTTILKLLLRGEHVLVKELERYLKQSGTVIKVNQSYLTVTILRLESHVITEEMLVSTALVRLLLSMWLQM